MLNKKGSSTIEAGFGVLLILIVIMAVANLIAISYERNIISQKVEILSVNASISGGLLETDRTAFLDELVLMGYAPDNVEISIRRVVEGVESGENIILTNMYSSNFVNIADVNNQLHLKIIVPYKEKTIFYTLFNDLENMQFERRFISRRS